jgi:hypothetical protein
VPPVERCTNHSFEVAERLCGDCGRPFCGLCMVTPFKRKPPLCHQCAVAAAGIRKGARKAPVRSRREIKEYERERRLADARPEPKTAGERGFGPAKPSITAAPSRPPTRAATNDRTSKPAGAGQGEPADGAKKPAGEGDEQAQEKRKAEAGRNRPLRGLAR